jgi:8-oxo-dGTP diphosphatase
MTRFCWRCGAALTSSPPTTCAGCGEEHYLNPRPCGVAVVIQERQVLLVRRALDPYQGCWDIPGGFCEADEHPMHAAERELAEETGLTGRASAYVGTWMGVYGPPQPDGVPIHTAGSVYLVELTDPTAPPRLQPDEVTEARWFHLDELPADLAFPAHARPVLAAVAEIIAGTAQPLPDRTW